MKKRLLKLLKLKQERKASLKKIVESTDKIEEIRSAQKEIDGLNTEIADLQSMIDEIEEEERNAKPQDDPSNIAGMGNVDPNKDPQGRNAANPTGGFNPLGTYGVGPTNSQQRNQEPEDRYGTLEYRKAFMDYCQTGKITTELRADATTTTGDVSAIIPSTILNEVIRKVTTYGQVFNRVRKLNIKGGLTIPILSLKPTATWIGETTSSDKQKVQVNENISFSYYGLECKISTSLLADTVSLAGFESTITDLIVEAMVEALDLAVLKGNGTGKPLGITADTRVPSKQIVTLTSSDFLKWDAWKKKVFAKMPLKYKAGASFLMASGTFEGYIDGMVDANGQPIGRVNYGITKGPQERFGGKEVIQVEDDVIAPYDDAAVGEVVAVYCNLRNYGFNSNMQMMMYRYFDHDTNEWVDKAILIADGKLIDPNGVVIIKKGE
ncbi:phage major capsid protein [Maledivibacter halophilus]|uniref:Phage major capsid protein, HK97 family n=1 Tax=Maledivibacter halophilus TaxID=36842 RepID=A0A1T5KFI6_9FIRM|nr:phage major capsid protein [Maledivibacter halophilus]SKC62437.1 phage major capsid protein, HK97 family [Maledivibacter halophilus]